MDEGDRVNPTSVDGGPVPKDTGRIRLAMVVVISFILLTTTTLVFTIVTIPDNVFTLKEGDYYQYEISGMCNEEIIQGSMNVTVTEATETGLSTMKTANYGHHFELFKYDMGIIRDAQYSVDNWVSNEQISTRFGNKHVQTSMIWEQGTMILTQAGCDSSLIYRLIVTCPDYFYFIQLNDSNNMDVHSLDTTIHHVNIQGYSRISETPSSFNFGEGTGGWMYGSISVFENEGLRYDLRGEGVSVYVFSSDDIRMMTSNFEFSCNSSLSIMDGEGEVDEVVEPGTYWYVLDINAIEEGSFKYYWR